MAQTKDQKADPRGRDGGPSMNLTFKVGVLRNPLGISAWRNVAHRTDVESDTRFIGIGSKKRLPPTPTLQAGFTSPMLGEKRNGWQVAGAK